jgi:hypothetical protein
MGNSEPGGDVVDGGIDTFEGTAVPCGNGGLDNNVTNEPKLGKEVYVSQPHGEAVVTADCGVDSALDKAENEPNAEVRPTAVGVADTHIGEATTGARSSMQYRARAPAAPEAVSRRKKKKSKREGRLERKALARRELERRPRAQLEGRGSVAEANKLIDDLREAQNQEFRSLMPQAPRAP